MATQIRKLNWHGNSNKKLIERTRKKKAQKKISEINEKGKQMKNANVLA